MKAWKRPQNVSFLTLRYKTEHITVVEKARKFMTWIFLLFLLFLVVYHASLARIFNTFFSYLHVYVYIRIITDRFCRPRNARIQHLSCLANPLKRNFQRIKIEGAHIVYRLIGLLETNETHRPHLQIHHKARNFNFDDKPQQTEYKWNYRTRQAH